MTRILTDTELAHLTIVRLQNLLKAARARANASDPVCDCCGERYTILGELDDPNRRAHQKATWDYFERVKKELQRRQA